MICPTTPSAGEIAEVVDRQRQVGGERLAHGLAVLPALGDRQHLEVLLHRVRDRVEHSGALGGGGAAPAALGGVCGVERELDVIRCGMRHLAERLRRRRGEVLAVLAAARRHPFAADEVLVAGLQLDEAPGLPGRRKNGRCVDCNGHGTPRVVGRGSPTSHAVCSAPSAQAAKPAQ
jgi:hypothetical protein